MNGTAVALAACVLVAAGAVIVGRQARSRQPPSSEHGHIRTILVNVLSLITFGAALAIYAFFGAFWVGFAILIAGTIAIIVAELILTRRAGI